jgi:DNA-binding NtrC family response regulator
MPATFPAVDDDRTWSISSLVGRSPALIELREILQRVASAPPTPVLLIGETGTGRRLAARVLHEISDRGFSDRRAPFVTMRCGAHALSPLESTPLDPSRVESLRGGTLFLGGLHCADHVMQQTLARLLDAGEVRVIGSADAHLESAVSTGAFDRELHDRLSGTTVRIPPLRLRASDVEPLADYYIEQFSRELDKTIDGMTPDALASLEAYSWPGNVRELKAVVERAVLVADSHRLQAAQLAVPDMHRHQNEIDLPPSGINPERLERDLVIQALQRTGGNQTRAATLLGLNRDQVRYRIEKFGLPRR